MAAEAQHLHAAVPLIGSSRPNVKETVLQYLAADKLAANADSTIIWGPSSVVKAKGKLVGSRVVNLCYSTHPFMRVGDSDDDVIEYIREALQPAEEEDADACAVDARVVLSFLQRLLPKRRPPIALTELLTTAAHDNKSIVNKDLEHITADKVTAEELGITMVARVLPALKACHLLALAQAQDLLLSSPLLEDLNCFTGPPAQGEFLHRALSSESTRTLRTLRMRGKHDKGTFRKLCEALSESNLRGLHLNDYVLDEEAEEMLSRVLVSPGCNLENLSLYSCSNEEMESLRAALVHPNCKIWGLEIGVFMTQKQALAFGDHVLKDEKNHLLMLAMGSYFPWEAMGSAACKLQAIVVTGISMAGSRSVEVERQMATMLQAPSSKIWYLDTDLHLLSRDTVEALQRSKVTHLHLQATDAFSNFLGGAVLRALTNDAVTDAFSNFLGSAHCQLESFQCESELRFSSSRGRELLMNALEMNYQSRLKTLKIPHVDQLRCDHIVKRNALFLASTQPPFVATTSAKLFICGHSGAGKTTIARNFNRRCTLPVTLQRHSTTQGIAMGVLDYNGKHAVICDIAGQEQFHAFHHYFVKGSQRNLFLVVCKVFTNGDGIFNMKEEEVKYWLRFISSHKALASRRKPKVLIALNYHGNGGFSRTCVERINELAQQYTGLLDILKDEADNMCFQVVALQVASLKQVKDALGVALADVLANHPPVPSLCEKVRDLVKLDKTKTGGAWWPCMQYKPRKQRVVTIEELKETILPGNDDNNAERTSAVKFTMACMHDMGESLYFGVDYENNEVLASSAILDMQWFVQELVGIFIQVSRDDDWWWRKIKHKQSSQSQRQHDDEYKVSMMNIVPKVEKMCSPNQLSYVLTALYEMGVLLPFDADWNGTWSRAHPKQVIVPALLQNEFFDTGWGSDERIYWGRRMTCKDQVCTLLPSGIFNVIQVKLKKKCKNPSFRLGKGWVCFQEDEVCVVVKVGGDTNHWVDRQWVDIMVMTPMESKRCLSAEDMVNWIKNCVVIECKSSLNLVEYVLNPKHIKATVQVNTNQVVETMAVTLEQIYEEAFEKGLHYSHTWDIHTSNEVSELLMPGELQGYVKDWESSIRDDYNNSTASVYNITEVEPWENFFVAQSDPTSTTIDPDLLKILKHMIHQLHNIDQQLVGIAAGINDLKAIARHTQQTMERYGQKVLAQCSKMLDKLNVSCPRYPYFTDMNNKIQKHCLVVATLVKLHYCCESSTKGIHQVDGSDGLVLELPHAWFSEHSHIIVPALTGIYFTMKIAGKALGAGGLFDFALDFLKDKVTDILNSVLTPELFSKNRKQPTESDINEIFARVERKAGGQRIDRFMRRTFGLTLKEQAWLCDSCL